MLCINQFLNVYVTWQFRLNAVREMCSRCPLVMSEDLLRDLAQYKNYRDRSVMMAARSLIQLYRHTMPTLLHRRDRVSTLTHVAYCLKYDCFVCNKKLVKHSSTLFNLSPWNINVMGHIIISRKRAIWVNCCSETVNWCHSIVWINPNFLFISSSNILN